MKIINVFNIKEHGTDDEEKNGFYDRIKSHTEGLKKNIQEEDDKLTSC